MFDQLSLGKEMYFRGDRPPMKYSEALLALSKEVGLSGDLDLPALEKKIKVSIFNEAVALTNHTVDASAHKVVTAFHHWVTSIHNNNLIPPPGNQWPNNIVYDMLSLLRNGSNSKPKEQLLRFFLEGLNARKMNKGETPPADFISTSLILQQVQTLSQKDCTSVDSKEFYGKYNSISGYTGPQKLLEDTMTKLKSDPMFAFLSAKPNEIFNFECKRNPDTGANAYQLDVAFKKGVESLKSYSAEKVKEEVQEMVNRIGSAMGPVLEVFQKIESTPSARLLGLWDASEWMCRAIVGMQIATHVDPRHKPALEALINDPVMAEIHQRSLTGDFPATIRNQDVVALEISELFTQKLIGP